VVLVLLQNGVNTINFTKVLEKWNQVQQFPVVHVVEPRSDRDLEKNEKKKNCLKTNKTGGQSSVNGTASVITAHIHFKSTNWEKIPVSAAIKLIGF